ncbi:hypothetical protein ACFC3Z_11755 [Enterococcus thailandicus]|uniref:hypothetical protein n=1 Tax=Enterococcus thailandicus TaxID=417368 RepID=UPI0035DCB9E8
MDDEKKRELDTTIIENKRFCKKLLDKNLADLEKLIENYQQEKGYSAILLIERIKDITKNLEDISIDIYTTDEIERTLFTLI